MIQLTSLKGDVFYLNPDLIERMEAIPDTMITLTSGKKLRVKETGGEVAERIVAFRRRIHGRREEEQA